MSLRTCVDVAVCAVFVPQRVRISANFSLFLIPQAVLRAGPLELECHGADEWLSAGGNHVYVLYHVGVVFVLYVYQFKFNPVPSRRHRIQTLGTTEE